MGVKAPKEVRRKIRPDSTVEWNPQILDDWMLENGVSKEWMATTIGKNKLYIYNCAARGRIGVEPLQQILELTNIDKELLVKKENKEVVDWKKPEGVNESKVGYWEFRGIKTDENGNPIFEDEKKEEPVTNAPEPKRTMPKGWISVMGIDFYQFIRADDIVQVKQFMNGARIITNHGTLDVIEPACIIMERMAECLA